MKQKFLAISLMVVSMILGVSPAFAQGAAPKFHVFNFNDGSILQNISDNGKWGVAFGSNQANSLWNFYPKLIDFSNDKVIDSSQKKNSMVLSTVLQRPTSQTMVNW